MSTLKDTQKQEDSYPLGQDPRRWKILVVVLTSIFMSLISVSIVNVALPSIQNGLGASSSDVQWVLSGYALTFGVVLVAAGRAGDLLGRGGLFLIGIAVYTGSSIAAGLAPSAEALNIARFVQGIGAGLLSPQGVGMIQQFFHGKERGRAFGWFGSTIGVAVAIGPVLGGLLIRLGGAEHGWRYSLLVNVPFGLLAMALALMYFPRPLLSRVKNPATGENLGTLRAFRSLDPLGAVLLGAAVLAFLYPFVESGGGNWIWWLIPAAIILLIAWVRWEQTVKHKRPYSPMVDLQIFRETSFRNGTLLAGIYFMGITSVWVLVAMYFQHGLGHTALIAGSIGIPAAIGSSVASNWAGKMVSTHGRLVVIAGVATAMFGLVSSIAVLWLHESVGLPEWWLILTLAFFGTGQGAVISPNQTLTLADVPLEYAGSSGAVLQTAQRIGTSIGLALITAIAFMVTDKFNWSAGVGAGFVVILGLITIAMGIAVYDRNSRTKAKQRKVSKVRPTTT